MKHSGRFTPYACLVLAPLFWAGNFVVARAVYTDIPPVAFNFWRWCLAFLFLAPLTLTSVTQEFRSIRREWKLCALLGVTGIALFQTFTYAAVHTTTALNASLYLSATPVFVIALSWRWSSENLTLRQGVGIVVSLLGVLLIVTRAEIAVLTGLRIHAGDLWMVAAVPLWAVYSVLLRRRPPDISLRALLMASIFFGLRALLMASIFFGVLFLSPLYVQELARGTWMTFGPRTALSLLYVSLFASAAAFLCWQLGVTSVGANKSSLFVHLVPIFSALFAFLFLGEPIWGPHLIGAPFILFGILLATGSPSAATLHPGPVSRAEP